MSFADFFPYVTGAGGALATMLFGLWLFLTGRIIPKTTHDSIVVGKDRQISDLTEAVRTERQRADAAVLAAQTTRDVLQALHREANM